ncbi:hypothetical protein D5S19_01390 [Amycolatopsis panacis]|uniref:Uncharacterized protein n=1 Tax=Amycolatopsis panacis TaxID=2340917 RepID=A0A419IBM7_9PSEU|nr:hypothetical protein D5S19_01390 [Amycolatopsis panacis]
MLRLAGRRPAAIADRSAAELADRTGIIAASVPGSLKRAGKPGRGRRLTGGLGPARWGVVGQFVDKSIVDRRRGAGAGAAEQGVGGQGVGGRLVDGPTAGELLVNGPTDAGSGVAETGCAQAGLGVAGVGGVQAGSGVAETGGAQAGLGVAGVGGAQAGLDVAGAGGVQAGSGVAETGGVQAGSVPAAGGRALVSPQAVVGRRSRRAVVIGASAVVLAGLGWLGGGLVTGGFSGSRPDTVATQAEPQVVVAPPGSWPTRPQVPVTSEAGPATVHVPVSPKERPVRKRVTTPPPVSPRQDIPLGPRQDVPPAGADQDVPRAGNNPPAPAPSVAPKSDFRKVVDHRWQPWTGLVRKAAGGR